MGMIHLGHPAPDFVLPDQSGQEIQLRELTAAGNVAMLFYTFDFTPV